MKTILLAFVIALVVGLPIGWLTAMLLTPVLWRLESILGIELAGHSGPADWVILLISGLCVAIFFAIVKRRLRR